MFKQRGFVLVLMIAMGVGDESFGFEPSEGFKFVNLDDSLPMGNVYDGAIKYNDRVIAYYRENTPGPSLFETRFGPESRPFLFGLDSGLTSGLGFQAEDFHWGSVDTELLPPGLTVSESLGHLSLSASVIQKGSGEAEPEIKVDTIVTITADTEEFTWTVDKSATILGGKILNEPKIEVVDTYAPGAVHFSSHIYQHLLLGQDDLVYRIPVNTTQSAQKYDWDFPAGQNFWWTFGVDPDGVNTTLEVLNHNSDIHVEVCWRYLDVHFWVLPLDRNAGFQSGETYTLRYRFRNRSSEETNQLVEASRLRQKSLPAGDIFPLYTPPYNGFQPGLGACGISSLRNFTWIRRYRTNPPVGLETVQDPACVWSDEGYAEPGSLAIFADDSGPHAWQVRVPDLHPNIYLPTRSESAAISVWIKTEAAPDGNGNAHLLYQITGQVPLTSEPVAGNADWTRVVLSVPKDYRANLANDSVLKLVANGPIRAWFDGLMYDTGVSLPAIETDYETEISVKPGQKLTLGVVGRTRSGTTLYQWHQRQRPGEDRILPLLVEEATHPTISFRIPENARGRFYIYPEIFDASWGYQRFGDPVRITVLSPEFQNALRIIRILAGMDAGTPVPANILDDNGKAGMGKALMFLRTANSHFE